MRLSFERLALLFGSGLLRSSSAQSIRKLWYKDSCTYRGTPKDTYNDDGNYSGDDYSGSKDECKCPKPPDYEEFVWEPPPSDKTLLDAMEIPKYVEHLTIPPVLFDDEAEDYHRDDNNGRAYFHVALRQIQSQVLPNTNNYPKFPSTTLWGYGDPDRPETFSNPSGSIEVTKDSEVDIVWINELVNDPAKCRREGDSAACNHLPHILQDRNGVPLVDATLHWANPPQDCKSPPSRPDCSGFSAEPYVGAIPMVVHNHGSHAEAQSDGYPEAWYLPYANTIPKDYATVGTTYASRELPSDDSILQCNADDTSYAVFRYSNDQPTSELFFHDHTLGTTRLTVYAAAAGAYIIRNEDDEGETYLSDYDCHGEHQSLPGPPAKFGQDPNNDPDARKKIREIPLIIRDMSFYDDGSLWYPSNNIYFHTQVIPNRGDCTDGEVYANNTLFGDEIPFLPDSTSDLHPVANILTTFDTIVVNGKTWPKLEVAPERYRFRMVNGADSRIFNLALKINYDAYHPDRHYEEIPFYVIGSDQGILPEVTKVQSCVIEAIEQCTDDYHSFSEDGMDSLFSDKLDKEQGKKRTHDEKNGEKQEKAEQQQADDCRLGSQALVISPGERYDVIVDFAGLARGDTVTMVNTGPEGALFNRGTWPVPFGMADPKTTGNVMKFVVYPYLSQDGGDDSTPPEDLNIEEQEELGEASLTRDLANLDEESELVCGAWGFRNCTWIEQDCDGNNQYGARAILLGTDGATGGTARFWADPITENPRLHAIEIWEFFTYTVVGHPMHVHLVEFEVIDRQSIGSAAECMNDPDSCLVGDPIPRLPYEARKDTVLAYAGQVTRIKMKFDRTGLYVWHCHILAHEDNEMMLPMCVGDLAEDCGQPPPPPTPAPTPAPPGQTSPLYLWESSQWHRRSFGNQETDLDYDALQMAIKDMSESNSGLGITATVFGPDGERLRQITEGSKYCKGPWRITDLSFASRVCNETNFVEGWDPDLKYAAYSGSKVIVAMTFLAAVVQTGYGSLDQPLRESVPEFFDKKEAGIKGDITPRQMLSHTSGIPFEGTLPDELVGQCYQLDFDGEQPSLDQCMKAIAFDIPLISDPGTLYEHSNINMEPLAKVVLELTGYTLDEAFQYYIAEPLGLKRTTYVCDLSLSTDEHPHSSLGICTTANEYSKIVQLLTNDGVVVDESGKPGKRLISRFNMNELFRQQTGFAKVINPRSLSINQGFDFGSSRCKPGEYSAVGAGDVNDQPISQIGYGLGTFTDTGTKGEVWFHESFMGPLWSISFEKYSILLSAQYPFFWATPWWFRVLDRLELASTFKVTPVGEATAVELETCVNDLWVTIPPVGEELFAYDCGDAGGTLPVCDS